MNMGTVLAGSVITFLIWACCVTGVCYLVGSVITSGVKASSHQCGTRYGVEDVLNGDWFCPATR